MYGCTHARTQNTSWSVCTVFWHEEPDTCPAEGCPSFHPVVWDKRCTSWNVKMMSRTCGSNSRNNLKVLLEMTFRWSSCLSNVASAQKPPYTATLLGDRSSGKSQWSKEASRKHLAAALYFWDASSARPAEHFNLVQQCDASRCVLVDQLFSLVVCQSLVWWSKAFMKQHTHLKLGDKWFLPDSDDTV